MERTADEDVLAGSPVAEAAERCGCLVRPCTAGIHDSPVLADGESFGQTRSVQALLEVAQMLISASVA
jgi:hypothetical protein